MNVRIAVFTLVASIMLVAGYDSNAQKGRSEVIITPLNASLKPMHSDKHAYVIEERWKENGTWKARMNLAETGALLAELEYADSTRNTLHGPYVEYGSNRKKKQVRTYVNGKVDGPAANWMADGILLFKGNITDEMMWGDVELYSTDGKQKAQFHTDINGNGTGVETLPSTGIRGEGEIVAGKQTGTWIYKDSSGKKVMEVVYNATGIVSETCFDANGNPSNTGECKSDRVPEFPGGVAAWKSYLEKNLKYPRELARKSVLGMVAVKFLVKADGSLGSVRAIQSPDPMLSKEAVRVIRESGKWIPGYEANTPVPFIHIQNITFALK